MSTKKIYILDTNVLLSDSEALTSFGDNDVVIPFIVIEELDRHKDRQDETGRNARETARKLREYTGETKNLKHGVSLGNKKGTLTVLSIADLDIVDVPKELAEKKTGDNAILQFCLSYANTHKTRNITVVTRDILLQIKCQVAGLHVEDYKKFHVATDTGSLYSGVATIEDVDIDLFFQENHLKIDEETIQKHQLKPNQFLILKDAWASNKTALAKFNSKTKMAKKIDDWIPGKLTPKNKEQKFAIDLLHDKNIDLVTLAGLAGSGKAQPLHSKILTPNGWTTMGQIKPGMSIIGKNGKETKVVGVYPQGVKEVFKVHFSDDSFAECCDDHLWNVKTNADRSAKKEWRTLSLKEIRNIMANTTRKDISIPMVDAVEFKEKSVPIESYLFGTRIAKDKEITTIPDDYKFNSIGNRIKLLQGLMDRAGYISNNGKIIKFISNSKTMAKEVKDLVNSLGGKATIKHNKFGNSLTYISMPNGINPFSLSKKAERYIPRTKYQPTRFIRKIESVGMMEAQCIKVEAQDQLYVTDDFIVTHNTLIAIASGLEQVLTEKYYKTLVVCRPIMPVGKDIGFLPGEKDEKLEPWISPIKDNLRYLLGAGKKGTKNTSTEETMKLLFENGTIEVEAMTFIRGRSIANAFIVIDEVQNVTQHELKTILTRVGEGSKIVLTGDLDQIDSMYLDSVSNGLAIAIEKFKDLEISGHITLTKGERSPLATAAAKIL